MSAPGMRERILLVDDEADIVELLEYNLRQSGYTVVTARDGNTALAEIRRQRPDLILLDLNLPDVAGTEVCRRLRRDAGTSSIPIMMITARGEEIDRVVGFELGADDYIVKPFSPRELVLRIGAVLRRAVTPTAATPTERILIGLLEIDVPQHRVVVENEDIPLTALEFKLLYDLASRPGRVQTRDALLERVWGYAPGIETRTVDTHVKRLREKLGAARDYIETVRGVGYRLRAD
ncbi:Phosphate regulon transcriptional regulatory protein PhoB [Sandaracinus amylolyticus]|uniref:Phosphate regulon transcriptional regulatory protein PhoB n=1 Tax=Sandaracinus amylolyticus TaxID=927083 RepID=A0A0F6YGN4_9BACT|nr:Phosphate regulon transcriptional regulatory protein PhoB [Sandaracinus amylolyticus]